MAKDTANTVETAGTETGGETNTSRLVRVPYRSFGAAGVGERRGQDGSFADPNHGSPADPKHGSSADPTKTFAEWAEQRNRRLIRLAKEAPYQPPAQQGLSRFATNYINKRSENNQLLNRMRFASSDAPDAAAGLGHKPFGRLAQVPPPSGPALPAFSRSIQHHPYTRAPALPMLTRRSFPSLVVLMILAWVVVVGAGVYKGLKPPNGFVVTTDRL